MRKPLFEPKETVFYPTLAKTGTIITCINEGEPSDVKIQGFRYYVQIGSWTHSIPEKYLEQVLK